MDQTIKKNPMSSPMIRNFHFVISLNQNHTSTSQKTKFQKKTGLKGKYTFLSLQQMQPDGMYTFAYFMHQVFEMLTGKLSNQKVKSCELSYGRFEKDWKELEEEIISEHAVNTSKFC